MLWQQSFTNCFELQSKYCKKSQALQTSIFSSFYLWKKIHSKSTSLMLNFLIISYSIPIMKICSIQLLQLHLKILKNYIHKLSQMELQHAAFGLQDENAYILVSKFFSYLEIHFLIISFVNYSRCFISTKVFFYEIF